MARILLGNMENVILLMLMTASVGQSRQVNVTIDHIVKNSPCPDSNPDCFPIYYWVCADFLTDTSSCPRPSYVCNDPGQCSSMKMYNETCPQIRLPPQTVTNEKAIRFYIAESLTEGNECTTPPVVPCRNLTTSFNFTNSVFSFQVTLSDVLVTSVSVTTPISTGPTSFLLSTRSTSYLSTASPTSTLATSSLLSTSGTLMSTHGISSPPPDTVPPDTVPPDTETSSGKGPLIGGVAGGSVVVIIIVVIIAYCCWKRKYKRNVVVTKSAGDPPATNKRDEEGISRPAKEESIDKEQLGLPETLGPGVILSPPPTQTLDQVNNNRLPTLSFDNHEERQAKTKRKKKRKKKKKDDKRPQTTNDEEKGDEQGNMVVDHETESQKERQTKEMEMHEREREELKNNANGEPDIGQEEEQATAIITSETKARKSHKKRKKREKQGTKVMSEVASDVDQEQEHANLMTNNENAYKEERKRERRKRRKTKSVDKPSTADEQIRNEETVYPSPQTTNEETFYVAAHTRNEETFYQTAGKQNTDNEVGADGEGEVDIEANASSTEPQWQNYVSKRSRKRKQEQPQESEDKEELLYVMND